MPTINTCLNFGTQSLTFSIHSLPKDQFSGPQTECILTRGEGSVINGLIYRQCGDGKCWVEGYFMSQETSCLVWGHKSNTSLKRAVSF